MKFLSVILTLFSYCAAYSQDSTGIKFSEEADTLTRQRFIDRYENVFMTKVQTRHMLKLGLSQYHQVMPYALMADKTLNNISLHVGYEFKFLRSFSLALSGYFPLYGVERPVKESFQNTIMDAQLRWFVDMRRRIESGMSANNFSGNYLALVYDIPGTATNDPKVGLKFGFQRRFLNHGYMDFSFALLKSSYQFSLVSDEDLAFSTQVTFGFAIGDWKKAALPPLCDILLCDEFESQQWKVRLPELTLGYYLNRIRMGIAYERKIASTSWTLNFQLDAAINNGYNWLRYAHDEHVGFINEQPIWKTVPYTAAKSKEMIAILSVQPRYYFMQNRQKLRGKGGNGLSGMYTGLHTEYNYYRGKHSFVHLQVANVNSETNIIQAGPLLGFQLRLFQHGYLDLNTSYNFKDFIGSERSTFGVRTNIGIGLAF